MPFIELGAWRGLLIFSCGELGLCFRLSGDERFRNALLKLDLCSFLSFENWVCFALLHRGKGTKAQRNKVLEAY
jgi:hypothetical protein